MKDCSIARRGGTKLFAAIGVKYPAGSTLSCTNGTKTLKAKNTSGQWVFAVPDVGTWTVTAVYGEKSKSAAVEITAEGQFVSVELVYRTYLFDNGEVVGWEVGDYKEGVAGASVETRLEGSTSSGSQNNGWCILTEEYIDLTDFDAIGINVDEITPNKIYIGVVKSSVTDDDATETGDYVACQEITGTGETTLDISSLNGSYRIGLFRDWWNTSYSHITASQVWIA